MNPKEPGFRPRPLHLVVPFLIVLALIALLESSRDHGGSILRARRVTPAALGSGNLPRILHALDLMYPLPVDRNRRPGRRFRRESEPLTEPAFYTVDQPSRRQLASAFLVDRDLLSSGLPVLSLLIKTDDLLGLHLNATLRGRETERPGYVGYFDKKRLRFASGVGVRIHGSARDRRARQHRLRNYRLYFRRGYGDPFFRATIFDPPPEGPVQRLVVRRAEGPDRHGHSWRYMNALGLDIARRIGMAAPRSRPAHLFINGQHQGPVVLYEHIQRGFLRSRFGHDDFVLVRTKFSDGDPGSPVREGDPSRYEEFLNWVSEEPPLSWNEAAARVDLRNLVDWFFLITYCGTLDAMQGALVLDQSSDAGRWFWIPWDLDISFGLPDPGPRFWEWDFHRTTVYSNLQEPRTRILRRLIDGDPAFRSYLARRTIDLLNHRLRPEDADRLLQQYRELAISFAHGSEEPQLEFLDEIAEFLNQRPTLVRRHLGELLGLETLHTLKVRSPTGGTLEIDGFPVGERYIGTYYAGMKVEIRAGADQERVFRSWMVNGENVADSSPTLAITLDADTRVAAWFDPVSG